jgi:alkanesulfonate monooxygenase SsuD/methylene tetrahydromethanopterin reductase-like flavin-dependent oxidoreductase (luciferase family)
MEFGVHIPVIVSGPDVPPLRDLVAYGVTAERLGYTSVATSDHIIGRSGWLDGPSILAAIGGATEQLELMTAILLPVVRHPASVAQTFGSLDSMTGGRVILGVGAGAVEHDYTVTGIPWEERWQRLDESIDFMRTLWRDDAPQFDGRFYRANGVGPRPLPTRAGGPPIWIGSWGSPVGLRRVARLGDGWIASGFNITPERFKAAGQTLAEERAKLGKTSQFDNALASVFTYISDDPDEPRRIATEILGPALGRDPDDMLRLALMGTPESCAERLAAYAEAGVQRVVIWPAAEHHTQIERFAAQVIPLLNG